MKSHLNQIREILNELETLSNSGAEVDSGADFSAMELPLIMQEIVDDLQPLLTPYEAAFYWYLFRNSIGASGSQIVRQGTRGLQTAAVKPYRSEGFASGLSLQTVRNTLSGLETIGAIRKEGEPNRDGTPYRVFVPDEIEACRKFRSERTAVEPKPEVAPNDIDYYNVRENRIKVYERDAYKCRYCEKQLTRFTATLDHVRAVAQGGDNSFDNLVTACLNCNSRKHHRPVGDFLAES